MRLARNALLLLIAASATQAAAPATPATPEALLHELFESEWERGLRENPLLATYLGDHRYDDRWPDASAGSSQKRVSGRDSARPWTRFCMKVPTAMPRRG